MTTRVGLTQRVDAIAGRDERRDALDQAWTSLLGGQGHLALPIPNRLADPAGALAELDLALLVLTGGNDLAHLPGAANAAPERDATERALLDAAAARGLPVLGVCRGMQAMLDHAGAPLRPVAGHAGASHPIEVHGSPRWRLDGSRAVGSFHDWGVDADAVPSDWEIVATAPDGTVEAVQHRERPEIAVMWHPERGSTASDDIALLESLVRTR